MGLSVSIMVHPTADQVSINPVENDAWLKFSAGDYTSVDVFLKPGVADAIIAALQPYASKAKAA